MTPKLDEIRQALAAATPPRDENAADDWYRWYTTRSDLMSNAPVWLTQLADEVERLRADLRSLTQRTDLEREQWRSSMTIRSQHIASLRRHHDELQVVRAERDAALKRCEELTEDLEEMRRGYRA